MLKDSASPYLPSLIISLDWFKASEEKALSFLTVLTIHHLIYLSEI